MAIKGHGDSYNAVKAGNALGAAAANFDDSGWRRLDLPHDWAVEGPFDATENLSHGYRPRGIGWYRRYFQLPASDRGRHIELQFDAIATHSTVWVNGHVVNRNWSGYNGRNLDITPYLRYGEDVNTIAVRVDADAIEGWWYEGAGIYRHTWLVKRNAVHIATDGVHANPVSSDGKRWSLPVEVEVNSAGRAAQDAEVEVELVDPAGNTVTRSRAKLRVQALGSSTARLQLAVSPTQAVDAEGPAALPRPRAVCVPARRRSTKPTCRRAFAQSASTPTWASSSTASTSSCRACAFTRTMLASASRCPTRSGPSGCAA